MDMFLLFVVVFLSIMLGIGLGAALLSLLVNLIVRLSASHRPQQPLAPAPAPIQPPRS